MEDSQQARAKESHLMLPLQAPLLSASPWSIVLPLLQVGFLQIVIAVHSQIFQRIQLRNVRVRFGAGVQWMPLNVSMWASAAVLAFYVHHLEFEFMHAGSPRNLHFHLWLDGKSGKMISVDQNYRHVVLRCGDVIKVQFASWLHKEMYLL